MLGTWEEIHLMWDFFLTKFSSWLLESCSQKFNAITLVFWFFTAIEQSEATGAMPLPAEEIPKSASVHGEPLSPSSLGSSMPGPDAARHKGCVRWLSTSCPSGQQPCWARSATPPSCMPKDQVAGPAGSQLITVQRHPPCRSPLLQATFPGRRMRPLPSALRWRRTEDLVSLRTCWRTLQFPNSPHLHPRNKHWS